jgi:hypothetical protein
MSDWIKVVSMAKFMKGLMLAALIMLFAASPLPPTQASARQINYDLKAPQAVGAGGVQPSAVFDFSVEVDPSAVSLKPGDSALCGIIVGLITGPAQEVSLMYTIPPVTGVSASISTVKGTPPFNLMLKISTTTQTPPGTYTINVVGVSGSLQRTASVTLTVTAAGGFDFSVEADPSAVSLKPGESASCTIDVGLVRGAAQEVSLDFEHPDFGATILLTIHGSMGTPPFTGTLEIVTTAEAPPGTYTINLIGVSGTLQRTATFTLAIVGQGAFDFSVTASPDSVSLAPGESASSTLSTKLVTGPAQEVSFMYTIPQVVGVGATISPAKGTPPFTSTVRISTTAQTPPGQYTINMAAVAGGVEKRISITLIVLAGGQPPPIATDWAVGELWMLPSNPKPGDQVSFSAKISALSSDNAFPQEVRVEVRLDHRQVAADTVTVPGEGLAVTVSAGTRWAAVAGSHTVSFSVDPADGTEYDDPDRGNNIGELSFTVSQTIQPPSGFDFSITVTPESQSLTPEGSVVYDVYVDLTAGTSETVSLALSGLPEDATYAFDPPTSLPYFPSKLTVYVPQYTAAGAPMPAGAYTLTVTAEGAGLVRTGTATLVVKTVVTTTTQQVQVTTQAPPTSVATTQAAMQTAVTKGSLGETLGGGGIFLLLIIIVIVAGAAYYVSRQRKAKPP